MSYLVQVPLRGAEVPVLQDILIARDSKFFLAKQPMLKSKISSKSNLSSPIVSIS